MLYYTLFVLFAVAYGDNCCPCQPTCAVPNPSGCLAETYDPDDPCQCPPGFILDEEGGECIQVEICPDNITCNGDPNARVRQCPSPCPSTCAAPNTSLKDCPNECQLGCECKDGYILSEENGQCIQPDDCPGGNPCSRPNEQYTSCTVSCTPVYCPENDVPMISVCDFPSPCDSGCVCNHNYRRLSTHNDTCIPAEECPPIECNRPNEVYFGCRPYCPREFCSELNESCSPPIVRDCDPRCTCKDGYYRNNTDVCVSACECCPYVPPDCGLNAYFEVCSFKCPPQTCPSDTPEYCDPGDGCCRNECRCNDGYYKDDFDNCIPADQCSPTISINETKSSSSSTSTSSSSSSSSQSSLKTTSITATGCAHPCPFECKSTCANPNPTGCDPNPDCNCKVGCVWTTDGTQCIPVSECPGDIGCKGDPNAYIKEKPIPCQSTCDAPDASPYCKRMQLAVGCVCNYGYLLNSDGICILPDECPGGNPCGVNGTFVSRKSDCPYRFCPKDDSREGYLCEPGPNTSSGCVCKYKYRWRSEQDRQCILSQECPAINCTRDNEEWNSCPSPCFTDSCYYFKNPGSVCNTFQEPECYPQCTCKSGYARSDDEVCINGEDCP